MLKPELGTGDLVDLGGCAGGAGCTNSTHQTPFITYRIPGEETQTGEPLLQESSLEPLRQADAQVTRLYHRSQQEPQDIGQGRTGGS